MCAAAARAVMRSTGARAGHTTASTTASTPGGMIGPEAHHGARTCSHVFRAHGAIRTPRQVSAARNAQPGPHPDGTATSAAVSGIVIASAPNGTLQAR